MQLLLIPRLRTLFDELFDCLAEAVKRLFVILLDRVDDAVLNVVLQNDLADVVDGRADRRNLNQDLRAVAPVFDHLLDRFQMPDGARQPVMRKFFEKLLSVMVRSSMPGSVRSGI